VIFLQERLTRSKLIAVVVITAGLLCIKFAH
jgi:multidrug transporter EmrE-like cation transporter